MGLLWLQKMAPAIEWARGLLLLMNSKRDPCITAASVASADPTIQLEYADYADLFHKKTADVLPAYQERDHCILLEKKKLPPYKLWAHAN